MERAHHGSDLGIGARQNFRKSEDISLDMCRASAPRRAKHLAQKQCANLLSQNETRRPASARRHIGVTTVSGQRPAISVKL
jgi:hypothetical protein